MSQAGLTWTAARSGGCTCRHPQSQNRMPSSCLGFKLTRRQRDTGGDGRTPTGTPPELSPCTWGTQTAWSVVGWTGQVCRELLSYCLGRCSHAPSVRRASPWCSVFWFPSPSSPQETCSEQSRPSTASPSPLPAAVTRFLDAMVQHHNRYLPFPTVREEVHRVSEGFYAIAGFPNVIGCVDRTRAHACSTPPANTVGEPLWASQPQFSGLL